MKTKIEEAADKHVEQYDNEPDKSWIAGAEFMQKEVNELKADNEFQASVMVDMGEIILENEKLKAQNEIMRAALKDIILITRRDGNDNEYEGVEAYISKKALKKVGEVI